MVGTGTGRAERRMHPRFTVRQEAFAVLHCSPARIGLIRDVSRGGLCFCYLNGCVGSHIGEDIRLDLRVFNADFEVKDIPFNLVADSRADGESAGSPLTMRRCGVKFGSLSAEQSEALGRFMDRFCLPAQGAR